MSRQEPSTMTDHSGNQEKAVEAAQPQLCVKCHEFFG